MEFNKKPDNEKRLNYKSDYRFNDIFQTFYEYISKKGRINTTYFDNSIWFLSGDKIFKKLLLKKNEKSEINNDEYNSTPFPYSFFHEIIFDLNENNNNSKSLKIDLKAFIERISTEILYCFELRERTQSLINKYKAHEMKNIIEQNKQKIKLRYADSLNKFKNSNYSKFHFVLKNVTNFPIGVYRVDSEITEICDKESDRETANTGKSDLTIYENKRTFVLNKKITVNKETSMIDLVNRKDKDYFRINNFEFKKFVADEREIKIADLSGTTFHKFQINFYKENGDLLGSFSKNFIVILLMNIEKVADILHEDMAISIVTRLDSDNDIDEYHIDFDIYIRFDPNTRVAILDNILKIFCDVVDMNTLYHNNIYEILNYFPDLIDAIENILIKPRDDKRNVCNACECKIL